MFCYKKGKGVYHTWDVGFREFTVFLYLCRILGSLLNQEQNLPTFLLYHVHTGSCSPCYL